MGNSWQCLLISTMLSLKNNAYLKKIHALSLLWTSEGQSVQTRVTVCHIKIPCSLGPRGNACPALPLPTTRPHHVTAGPLHGHARLSLVLPAQHSLPATVPLHSLFPLLQLIYPATPPQSLYLLSLFLLILRPRSNVTFLRKLPLPLFPDLGWETLYTILLDSEIFIWVSSQLGMVSAWMSILSLWLKVHETHD